MAKKGNNRTNANTSTPMMTASYGRSACSLIQKNLLGLQEKQQQPSSVLAAGIMTGDDQVVDGSNNADESKARKDWFLAMASQLLDTTRITSNSRMPICTSCNASLQPGCNGSTLRLKSLQKQHRKTKRMRQPKHKSKFGVVPKRKNQIVLQCGTCLERTQFPTAGLLLPKRTTATNVTSSSTASSIRKTTNYSNNQGSATPYHNKRHPGSSSSSFSAPPQSASKLEDNLDFVPLSKPAPAANANKKRLADLAALHNPTNLLGSSKKKKKGKKKKNSSQLMDFLSNLNE